MKPAFDGSKLYIMIPISAAHDNRLRANSKLVFGEIMSMLNQKDSFFMNNATLAKRQNMSTNTLQSCLKELEDLGYIRRKIIRNDKKQVVSRLISSPLTELFKQTPEKWGQGYPQKYEKGIPKNRGEGSPKNRGEGSPKNLGHNNESLIMNSNNSIYSRNTSGKPDYIPKPPNKNSNDNFSEQVVNTTNKVIDHLNHKAGTKYRPTSKATRRLVRARLNDGWKLDDFYKVINNKVSDWKNDKYWAKYLRPETLFGTKFESYLNESAASGADDYPTFEEMAKETPEAAEDDNLPF